MLKSTLKNIVNRDSRYFILSGLNIALFQVSDIVFYKYIFVFFLSPIVINIKEQSDIPHPLCYGANL